MPILEVTKIVSATNIRNDGTPITDMLTGKPAWRVVIELEEFPDYQHVGFLPEMPDESFLGPQDLTLQDVPWERGVNHKFKLNRKRAPKLQVPMTEDVADAIPNTETDSRTLTADDVTDAVKSKIADIQSELRQLDAMLRMWGQAVAK